MNLSPVRNEKALWVFGGAPGVTIAGIDAKINRNKANIAESVAWEQNTLSYKPILTSQGLSNSYYAPIRSNNDTIYFRDANIDLTETQTALTLVISDPTQTFNLLILQHPLFRLYAQRQTDGKLYFWAVNPTQNGQGADTKTFEIPSQTAATNINLLITTKITTWWDGDSYVDRVTISSECQYKGSTAGWVTRTEYTPTSFIGYVIPEDGASYCFIQNQWDNGIYAGLLQIYNGKIASDRYNATQWLNHLPIFDVEAIGLKDFETATNTFDYAKNNNVTMESIPVTQSEQPGKLRWSRGGTMPELQEIIVPDGITAMHPMKSFAPTAERNTLLVWTAKGDLVRIVFSGESAEIVPEISGAGIPSLGKVIQAEDAIYWASSINGIVQFSANGMKYISKDRIANQSDIFYLERAKLLMAVITGQLIPYYYNPTTDTWTKGNFMPFPSPKAAGNIGGDDLVLFKTSTTGQMYRRLLKETTYSITTKKFSIGSCLRLKVNGVYGVNRILALVYIYGSKIANGVASVEYITIPDNKPLAIPGFRNGEYISIRLSCTAAIQTTAIHSIDIEVIE
jgi:hypothetical protein